MNKPSIIKYKNGQEEPLSFLPLTNTELYQFVDLLVAGRTPEIVALCTHQSIAWVNGLELACFLRLAKEFIRENFKTAMEIATEDPIAGLKVGPLLLQMGALLNSLPSPSSALTPSSAAPVGSDSPTTPAPAAAAAATPAAATA